MNMAALKQKTAATRIKKQAMEEKIPGVHVGTTLRETREAQNLSLDNVADELMIRRFYLEALENGTFKDLPERVYATGFVKNYANYLGMDIKATVEQFKRDAYGARNAGNYQVELVMPEPVAHSIVPNRSAIVSAIVVLIVLVAGIVFFTQSEKKTAPVIPAPVTESAPLGDARTGDGKAVENAAPNNAAVPPSENSVPANTTTAAPQFTTTSAGPAVATPAPATPVVKNRRVIEALQSSWVEIKDPAGKTLFTNILKVGQLLPLPENTKVTLTTGNAGGLRLVLDGVPQAALGQINEVKRNMAIDVPAASLEQR
jgi:cytoskeleton protein RodZ